MKLRDLTNQKFGMLTALYRISTNRSGQTIWQCKCDCGNEKQISMDHLTRKKYPIKSCGCLKKTIKGKNHPQWTGHEEISGDWWYNHVERERKQGVRQRVPVLVTKEYAWELFIKQKRKCALSDIDLVISKNSSENTASIDRIDSGKGYEEGNIQWVHKHVNFMKRTYDQDYFIKMCYLVTKNTGGNCEVV